ncbi:unnamed protein product [Spirodela intermedia]|uniref:Dof zinc finger protein n=1 Tax=Spirodela intermedia TaxID=51605 RepID=A0A7I8K9L6_SPIIN|nr:unnamed protein product [Spirodela intermedia]
MDGNARVSSDGRERGIAAGAELSACGGEAERCPRCGSQNTKFCYYNNYNLAQPRHFCKACRRYWTVGGSLRNVPVGGSTRRAAAPQQSKAQVSPDRPISSPPKSLRRRSATAPASAASSPSSSCSTSPPLDSLASVSAPAALSVAKFETDGSDEPGGPIDAVRCFESVLGEPLPAGFLALGDPFLGGHDGYALGLGLGGGGGGGAADIVDEMGFSTGKVASAWPFFEDDDGAIAGGGGGNNAGMSDRGGGEHDAWRVVAGESELVRDDGGDYCGWPDLAVPATRGKRVQ